MQVYYTQLNLNHIGELVIIKINGYTYKYVNMHNMSQSGRYGFIRWFLQNACIAIIVNRLENKCYLVTEVAT